MANELILMPLRIGIRVANVCLRPIAGAAEQLLALSGRVRGTADRDATTDRDHTTDRDATTDGGETSVKRPARAPSASAAASTPAREPAAPTAVAVEVEPPREAEPPRVEAEPPRAEAEPRHVSEEPELVSEFAEPGAEDGAGAQTRVDEPWPGYRQWTADQVIERLPASSPEELAVVELYERSNRNRHAVVSAVERELKRATADHSAN